MAPERIASRTEIFVLSYDSHWFFPGLVPVRMPVGLHHVESDYCWCDPLVEIDENGNEEVLHRQVTWN
jgi:hypothetical protein